MITGENVIIRQLELGDEDYLYKWWNDGEMMAHATFPFGTMQSKEAIRKNITDEIESYNILPEKKRFIICKKATMEPIGEINYADWSPRNQKCEFGIKICEMVEQGKGYGKDALYHFIDFLFRSLNLNKIELTSMIDNERAHKLYKQLGFKEIGIIREGFFDSRKGTFSDVVYMDLLKTEWLEIKKTR
ncbi:GNAT family N-acetyltransferase [Lutispora sp.]|uniref:GNAT family N-acetyltransferase n=1 Tax=Lutispora sp. TaxID=2828727 RepID=UPI000EC1E851|nr:GNAT family protein [Lutispora sp.]MEA4960533.1 GNAT family protein [Lutispora sp.]HCJ56468.1 GNAT family N-acetyltransferase [Clostridiaceae bacterium]